MDVLETSIHATIQFAHSFIVHWHSPNNDPKFGVRVKDVSLYEYRVGKASAVKPAESVAAPAPAAAPAVEAEPAKSSVKRTTKVA